jgi:hypothetical protein
MGGMELNGVIHRISGMESCEREKQKEKMHGFLRIGKRVLSGSNSESEQWCRG